MIFLTRHGERSDFLNEDFHDKTKYLDAPLTSLGHDQAKTTGKEIKKIVYKLVEEKKLPAKPQFMILSSPFLRTIETAAGIAEAFDPDELYDKSIFVQNGCSECLYWYPSDPMNDIEFAKLGSDAFYDKYSISVRPGFFDESLFVQAKFPEGKDDFIARVQKFYAVLFELYMERLAKEGVVLIIATHGWGIKGMLQYVKGYDESKSIDYCSLSAIYYEKPDLSVEPKVLLAQSHDHLDALPKSEDVFSKKGK